jgi:tRNA uridine 5-carbamoylmethylation protein Kti12
MSNVTDIDKYRPNPNEYFPSGPVLMAMQWYEESDPQRAWDKLIHQVLKEIINGDEEVEKVRSGREIVEWADQFRKHFTPTDLAEAK